MLKKRQKIRTGILLVSFFLFPAFFYFFSPYLIIEGTLNGVITGSFLMFALQFLSALILGRGFCGWVCPAGGAQEALIPVRSNKVTKGNFIKWLIWTPWVAMIILLAIKNGGYREINPFYQMKYGLSINSVYALITYLMVLMLIVLPALFVGRRSFCHHLCWMAPFMIIGRKIRNVFGWRSLRLEAMTDRCTHCHTCTENCPMSLPVEQMVESNNMENTECILCGSCIDGCKSKAIKYRF
jgi:polyferredoxin